MQLKIATLERKTGDLTKSNGGMMPPIGCGRYCQIIAEKIEHLLRLVENSNISKNELIKKNPFVCSKYNGVQLLNATEEDEWVLDCCRTNTGIIIQTPVGSFQLSAAKQSPCYLEENELPNISRLIRVILKWMPEGVNKDRTNIRSRTACLVIFFLHTSRYFISTCLTFLCIWDLWKCEIVVL